MFFFKTPYLSKFNIKILLVLRIFCPNFKYSPLVNTSFNVHPFIFIFVDFEWEVTHIFITSFLFDLFTISLFDLFFKNKIP